jgi:hypothetical protein
MLRYLILEVLLPLMVFWILRSVIRSIVGATRSFSEATRAAQPSPQPANPGVVAGGELRKDPVCGTYVSTGSS